MDLDKVFDEEKMKKSVSHTLEDDVYNPSQPIYWT